MIFYKVHIGWFIQDFFISTFAIFEKKFQKCTFWKLENVCQFVWMYVSENIRGE